MPAPITLEETSGLSLPARQAKPESALALLQEHRGGLDGQFGALVISMCQELVMENKELRQEIEKLKKASHTHSLMREGGFLG